MRLFFKHILRSIKRRPTQPVILLLTLALSVIVSTCTLTLRSNFLYEGIYEDDAILGSADIKISLNSSSESRFMFTEDVGRVLEKDIRYAGYYEVFLSKDSENSFSAAAADFDEIGNIFNFGFTAYAGVNESNREYSVFISSDFAKRMKLSLDDEFKAELLGASQTYRVAGISKKPFIGKYDILLDISGVSAVLSSKYPFAAAMGESFRPCNVILVDLPKGENIQENIDILKADESFSDKSITDATLRGGGETNDNMLFSIINFAVILVCIMSAIVSYSCFAILSSERSEENYSFKVAGARSLTLRAMQYIEALLYWICGSALGVILSIPTLSLMRRILSFKHAELKLEFAPIAVSLLLLLLSLLLSVTVFIFGKGQARPLKSGRLFLSIFTAASALAYALTFILPRESKMLFGIISVVFILLFAFLAAGDFLLSACKRILKLRDAGLMAGNKLKAPALHYCLKNLVSVKALRGVVKMTSLLIGAALCIAYTINGMNGQFIVMENLFISECVVINGTERCYDKISECESVSSVDRLYFAEGYHEGGIRTVLMSADNLDALNSNLGITYLPDGNEAVISEIQARALGLDIGDTFTVKENNREIELCLADTVKTAISFVFFDCNNFGIDYAMLLPSLQAGFTAREQMEEISEVAAEEVASVINAEAINESFLYGIDIYIKSGNFICIFIAIFSVIGIIDTFIECYRSRKEEFVMYETAGMSRRHTHSMRCFEILISVAFAFLVGLLVFALLLPLINETMLTICYDAYESFITWIRV